MKQIYIHTARFKLVIAITLLSASFSFAQVKTKASSYQEKVAEKQFNNYSYKDAVVIYQLVLREDSTNTRALKNLATCYRKLNDMKSAERTYRQLFRHDTTDVAAYLSFAKTLASNRKYSESLMYYKMYSVRNPADREALAFIDAYNHMDQFFKDSTFATISLLNINSGMSDFSPAFYNQGLVFVSNRVVPGEVVKRVYEWDESPFLELYYIDDTSRIKTLNTSHKSDTTLNDSLLLMEYDEDFIINDDDTYHTSNDSRTLGYADDYDPDTLTGFVQSEDIGLRKFSNAISSKYHEGPLSFFSHPDSVIFTRNNYHEGKYREDAEGVNKLKLYTALYDKNDSLWHNIKGLPFNSDHYSTGHPAIAPGDSMLYFVSDMPGGFGGTDIYYSIYSMGTWKTPVNLGDVVNTSGNEMFPYVDSDQVLYFSSDGHPGLGGLDIFKWSLRTPSGDVTNMGYPINSNHDDFGLILNKRARVGYLSSNRRNSKGDDDIYRFVIRPPFIIQVVDSNTNQLLSHASLNVSDKEKQKGVDLDTLDPGRFSAFLSDNSGYLMQAEADQYASKNIIINADADSPLITIPLVKLVQGCIVAGTVTDKDTHEPIEGARVFIHDRTKNDTVFDFITGSDGRYRYVSLESKHQYDIYASKEGYFNKPPADLNTSDNKCLSSVVREYDYLRDFTLEAIILGRAIKIENIYFDLAKYNIRKSAAAELDKIVRLLEENPDIIIELSSHTDCRASFKYNMKLSDNRAKASADYIISKGINKERITGKGYGESKLVNDCACEGKQISRPCTDEEHQANRRTEFQVTGFLKSKETSILNDGKGSTPESVPVPEKDINK